MNSLEKKMLLFIISIFIGSSSFISCMDMQNELREIGKKKDKGRRLEKNNIVENKPEANTQKNNINVIVPEVHKVKTIDDLKKDENKISTENNNKINLRNGERHDLNIVPELNVEKENIDHENPIDRHANVIEQRIVFEGFGDNGGIQGIPRVNAGPVGRVFAKLVMLSAIIGILAGIVYIQGSFFVALENWFKKNKFYREKIDPIALKIYYPIGAIGLLSSFIGCCNFLMM